MSFVPEVGLPHRLVAGRARRDPGRVAISGMGVRVGYGELDERANRLAHRLLLAGVRSEDVVAVMVDKTRPDFVVAALAAWKVGAVYMPIDPRVPAAQVRRMFAGTEPVALLGSHEHAAPHAGLCATAILSDEDLTGMPDDEPDVRVSPEQLAYIVHTSGSTGTPKPVAMSHRALVSLYFGWKECYRLEAMPPRWLQAASPSFDVHIGDMARALFSGGRLVLCATELLLDPPQLAELIARESVECMDLTPTVLTLLADRLTETGESLPSLRLIICGGEQMMTADYRKWRAALGGQVRIVNAYGVSEGGVESTLIDVSEDILQEDVVPIGHPLPGAAIAVLDASMSPVAPGEAGELYIADDRVAQGYYRRPDLTEERFFPAAATLPGPTMYRTGDMVRQRPDGALVFLGRGDDEVKIRGIRVRLGAVEAALLEQPEVVQVAAVRAQRAGEDTLVAHVVLTDSAAAEAGIADRLRDDMAARVSDAMVPAEIVAHRRLPLNRSGKVDRQALRSLSGSSSTVRLSEPAGVVAPGPLERAVAESWTRALGRPPGDRAENLFAAGGTSLTAARLTAMIRSATGVDLSVSKVFASPRFDDLVDVVAATGQYSSTIVVRSREDDGTVTLAPGQHGLWLLHELRKGDRAYHLPTVLRFKGPLKVEILQRALDALIDRHDALRTAVVTHPDGPRLRVVSPMSFPLAVETDRAVLDELVSRPFDLDRAPLIRGALVRYAPDRHDLVLVTHHVVFDDWSERVLLRELGEVYSAMVAGRDADLPSLAVSHLDHAAWRSARLDGPEGTRQREYWTRALAGLPSPVSLPGAGLGRPGQGCGTFTADLPDDLSGQVRRTAEIHGVTPYVVLLAGLAVLLRQWSGQSDLVIGAPFGYRDRPETQNLVGFLVSTLALRVSVPDDAAYADVIASARDALVAATAHADVPFDQVVHDLGLAGCGARNQVFRVWFNWLGDPVVPPVMTDLTVDVEHTTVLGALFDLGVYVTDTPTGLRLDLVVDRDVLDDTYMAAFLDQYAAAIGDMCADPVRPVVESRTPQDDPALAGLADTAGAGIPDVLPALADVMSAYPRRVAVAGPDESLTYGQLRDLSGAVTARLREAGVGSGDVVPIYAERVVDLVPALLGVWGTGAAFAILDSVYPAQRLAAQVGETASRAGLLLGARAPAELRAVCPQWLDMPTEAGGRWPAASAGDTAYLAFTSGTTGTPRAVSGGFEPLANFLAWYADRYGFGRDDTFAMLSGLSHDPLLRDILTPLWTGGTLAVPPAGVLRRPADLLAWLRSAGVTVLHLTPALARTLAGKGTLPQVRLVVCGGDALHGRDVGDICSWAPGATVVNAYGTTETPQVVSLHEIDPATGLPERVPIGTAAPGTELRVLDPAGRPAAVGVVGEITVHGPYLATAQGVSADPVAGHRRFATGDLGRRGPAGEVTVLGRADDQVQIRGFRVEQAEVDRLLRAHPAVRDAACRTVPGPDGENHLIGYVVADDQAVEDLRTYLRSRVPSHLIPARVVAVPAIPLTANGKPDRAALPLPGAVSTAASAAVPETRWEKVVHDVWCGVLAAGGFSVDDNFFDLGASSMSLVKAQVALETALGREVPVTALFEHTTIRRLAVYLAGTGTVAGQATPARRSRSASDLRARRLAARDRR